MRTQLTFSLHATCFVAALSGCAEESTSEVCVPPMTAPRFLTVIEGSSTTFDIGLVDPNGCSAMGRFGFIDESRSGKEQLSAEPMEFALTRMSPSTTVTITASTDTDAVDHTFIMVFYIFGTIAGESPGARVTVLDSVFEP